MQEHQVTMHLLIYEDFGELAPADQVLLEEARKALAKSYAPYSKFQVGAAALLADGTIISGANQENAAYPMCLCAERVTLAAIESYHFDAQVLAMAVTVKNPNHPVLEPAAPCGSCRQALSEKEDRQKHPIRILLRGETGPIYEVRSGKDLLPLNFNGSFL